MQTRWNFEFIIACFIDYILQNVLTISGCFNCERNSKYWNKVMDKSSLIQAYQQTIYRVHFSEGDIDCWVGEAIPEKIKALLARVKTAMIITAFNPASQLRSDKENQHNNRQLQSELDAAGYLYYPATGIAKAGDWQEASFLVAGISRQWADELTERYAQNAYVWLEQGKPVELVLARSFSSR